jgi:hypothetical protein
MLKKLLCCLFALALGVMGTKIYAQEKKLIGIDLGLQVTTLGEVGVFLCAPAWHFYYGAGMNWWEPDDYEGDPYWNDIIARLGYTYKFKNGIGLLGGIQFRWVGVRSNWRSYVSYSSSSGYSSSLAEWHFVFMTEIGVSYTWKRLFGNIAYQLDTNNIKNSTLCFVAGRTL